MASPTTFYVAKETIRDGKTLEIRTERFIASDHPSDSVWSPHRDAKDLANTWNSVGFEFKPMGQSVYVSRHIPSKDIYQTITPLELSDYHTLTKAIHNKIK
jgi:hypothetical protein